MVPRILVAASASSKLGRIAPTLGGGGALVTRAGAADDLWKHLASESFDLVLLRRQVYAVVDEIGDLPQLTDVRTDLRRGFPELRIRYDREQLAARGLAGRLAVIAASLWLVFLAGFAVHFATIGGPVPAVLFTFPDWQTVALNTVAVPFGRGIPWLSVATPDRAEPRASAKSTPSSFEEATVVSTPLVIEHGSGEQLSPPRTTSTKPDEFTVLSRYSPSSRPPIW